MTRLHAFALLAFTVIFTATTGPAAAEDVAAKFHWKDHAKAGTADLLYGKSPVLRYMYAFDTSDKDRARETYNVYHHVFGPGTKTLITKGPGGLYTHHRGMFVGWNKTRAGKQRFDFWHCSGGAHLRHVKFLKKEANAKQGTMTALIHWNDAEGKPVIVESRTVTVRVAPHKSATIAWQIDWSTKLESRRGEISLSGDRQHAGFQFRAAQEVAKKKSARYIRPEGFPQQPKAFQVGGPVKHINLKWFAMHFEVEGKTYTAEYFEDPSLPKPSRYSERPYGRFGAFFEAKLTEKKPLTMRYRVRISTGKPPSQSAIQHRYEHFVEELESKGESSK